MKKVLICVLVVILALSAFAFTACNTVNGGIKQDGTVLIGATSVPHAEILEFAAPILLKKYNIKVEIVEVENWVQLNPATVDGDIYANYFQHGIYLNEYNQQASADAQLVSIGEVHVEPLGIYSNKKDVNLKAGNLNIALTNDATNQSRALRLLQAQEIITIKQGSENKEIVTVNDFEWGNNKYKQVNAELLVTALPDVDIAVIPGNYALSGDLKQAVVTESQDVTQQYANIIAVKKGNENSDISKALIEVLTSQEVKDFIKETYGDAVQAVA